MSNQSLLDETARLDRTAVQVYRYAVFVFVLGLFVVATQDYLSTAPGRDPYRGFVFPLMLLFSHLALAFRWPRPATIALEILSSGWMVFGLLYLFYWSRVLYPIHTPGAN
jgi:hypothetical protein